MESTTKIERKLSTNSLGLDAAKIVETMQEGEEKIVASFIGRATGYDTKASKFDATRSDVRFKGSFEGINLLTGETVSASGCYLPGAASDNVQNAVDALAEDEQAVDFAVLVSLRKNAKVPSGYTWGVAVPHNPEASDPLARMRDAVKAIATATPAALQAPKAKKEKAD